MRPDEWIRYTVNVETAGVYDIDLRVASGTGTGLLSLKMNERDMGDPVVVPNTGGFQNWITVTIPGVTLAAGEQVMRLLVVESSDTNINRMTFKLVSPTSIEDKDELPSALRLLDVYPNPFADRLTVRFESASGASVGMKMFDVLGRQVYEEPARAFAPGEQLIDIEPALGAGVYFIRLEIQEGNEQRLVSRKVVVGG